MANARGLNGLGINVVFSGVHAVEDVDLSVRAGEILGLIGPNGAGKTTLVNAITGFVPRSQGTVVMDGVDVSSLPPHRLALAGMVRTFQGVRVFPEMTVFENVEVGALHAGVRRNDARRIANEAMELMELGQSARDVARILSHGAQRRLEMARAIAMQPRYLLLDEPAAGLSEVESDQLMRSIRVFQESVGAGVLIIEHDMRVIMGLCDRIQVLDFGRTIRIGTPEEVRSDAEVVAAYLGPSAGEDARKDGGNSC